MKKLYGILTCIFLVISCKEDNKVPTANAGNDQSINDGATVTLNGSASFDPDGDLLTYKWTAPTGITLSSETVAQPTFTAPKGSAGTTYVFTLVVNDGQADSPADEVVFTNEDKFSTFIIPGQDKGEGIYYVDVKPDEKLNLSAYTIRKLDLNNDSIYDFELRFIKTPGLLPIDYQETVQIIPLGKNSVCVSDLPGEVGLAESLRLNGIIDSDKYWSNSKALLYSFFYMKLMPKELQIANIEGYFFGSDMDQIYVGVRIMKDGKPLFGWIDMKRSTLCRYAVTVPY